MKKQQYIQPSTEVYVLAISDGILSSLSPSLSSGGEGTPGDEGDARVSIPSDDTDNSTDMWGAGW